MALNITVTQVRNVCGVKSDITSDTIIEDLIEDVTKKTLSYYNIYDSPKKVIEVLNGNGKNQIRINRPYILKVLENIKKRGRSYEMQIPAEYLEKINQGYLDFIKTQTNLNVLIIDVSDKDFVNNQEDYIFILEEIEKKIAG